MRPTAPELAMLVMLAGFVPAAAAEEAVAAEDAVWSSQEVFVSTGAHGEASFSDVAVPGAERVEVVTAPAADDPAAELDRRIERTLAVAGALEESRLAREKARAEARAAAAEAAARSEPRVVYQDRYVSNPYLFNGPYAGRLDGHRRFRGHDGRGRDGRGRRDDGFDDGHGRDHRGGERSVPRKFLYHAD